MNQLSDYIKEYIAFTKDECDLIIDFYENNLDQVRASQVYTAQNHGNLESVDGLARKSNQIQVPFDASIDGLIEQKLISSLLNIIGTLVKCLMMSGNKTKKEMFQKTYLQVLYMKMKDILL